MALVNSLHPVSQRRSHVHLRSLVLLVAAGFLLRCGLRCRNTEGKEGFNTQPSFVFYKTTNLLNTVNESLPGAMPGQQVMDKALHEIGKYGVHKENSIYGQSCCPDEINGDRGHLPKLMPRTTATPSHWEASVEHPLGVRLALGHSPIMYLTMAMSSLCLVPILVSPLMARQASSFAQGRQPYRRRAERLSLHTTSACQDRAGAANLGTSSRRGSVPNFAIFARMRQWLGIQWWKW